MGVGVREVPTGASAVHGLALLISWMKRPFCTADLSIKLIEMHWGWITITMARSQCSCYEVEKFKIPKFLEYR